ncbi:MAG: hypothetical protein IK134_02840 [Oscillospiraceae bacterium]|nr:hypothetical protein [Oscillospiraceae bacterium]
MKLYITKAIAIAAALAVFGTGSPRISPSAADVLRGDLDGDGKVSVEDAQLTLNAYAQTVAGMDSGLTETQKAAANVNGDKEVSVEDAQLILLYYVNNTLAGTAVTWESLLSPEKPENRFPNSDEQLTVLCWTDDDIHKMFEHFTEAYPQYKNKVEYWNVGSAGGESREMYASYFAGNEDVDLYVTEFNWLRDYTDNDEYSAPITDLGFSESDFSGNYPYTLTIGKNANGVLKAVTWQATPGGYVYRSDLAKKYLGVSTPEEMQPLVKDWDAFTETAAKLKTASDGKTAMAATFAGTAFPWTQGKHSAWTDADNKLQFGKDAEAFYQRMTSFRKNGYITDAEQWSDDWYTVGQNDRTLGYFFTTWCLFEGTMLSNVEGDVNGKTYGLYNITEGPAAWYWGGAFLTLSPKCNSGKAAHDFIEHFVVNPDTMASYAEKTGEFVNSSAAMQKVKRSNPLLGGQSEIAVLDRNAKALDISENYSRLDYDLSWSFMLAAKSADTYEDAVLAFKKEAAKTEDLIVE